MINRKTTDQSSRHTCTPLLDHALNWSIYVNFRKEKFSCAQPVSYNVVVFELRSTICQGIPTIVTESCECRYYFTTSLQIELQILKGSWRVCWPWQLSWMPSEIMHHWPPRDYPLLSVLKPIQWNYMQYWLDLQVNNESGVKLWCIVFHECPLISQLVSKSVFWQSSH